MWVETDTDGGRRFMATCRKEEVDAGRHRQEKKRGNKTGKVVIAHGSVEFYEATHIGLVDELMESCTGARQTETCVAPRHVDASRDFYFIYSERATWEVRGGCAARLSPWLSFSRFSRPRAGLATVLSSFFGLATNTLNVRTKNNKNHE